MVEAPAKPKDLKEVIEDRIHDLWYTAGNPVFSDAHRMCAHAKIDALEWVKDQIDQRG